MSGKFIFFIIATLVVNLTTGNFVFAESKPENDARYVRKIKAGLAKIGVGTQARIEVKLKDKTTVKGYVKETNDDGFTVVNSKTGEETVIPYSSAKQIKGNNLSTGAKIAIGLGILAGVLAIFLFFENYG